MDSSRYKMLTDIGFNWSVKGRKCNNRRDETSPCVTEEYHESEIHDSPDMDAKAPLHVLMGDYNESHQGMSQREMESLQRSDALEGNINTTTEDDIL